MTKTAWRLGSSALVYGILSAAFGSVFVASAASFDCAKAASSIEKAICSDARVSELDAQLERAYQRALSVGGPAEALKSEQRAWLTNERNRCADAACLQQAYRERLAALEARAPAEREPAYSFEQPPFVSPLIVNELTAWLSDSGDQVLVINVSDAQHSNRYSAEIQTRKRQEPAPYVYALAKGTAPDTPGSEFGYQHVGRTRCGIDVLRTFDFGAGGSGVFQTLLLVKLERDAGGLSLERAQPAPGVQRQTLAFNKKRLLIRKLGSIDLGDRWAGQVRITGNDILISDILISDRAEPSAAGNAAPARVLHLECAR